ncbi:hypothetical protein S7335_143 [Synechococcus sp. PCC 7335]|uniref:hypothetical protein n=1 Tax=Synechococcus sp. (strain ATCC 29403 / PCC 7335) TaxID=91464 RepID=UPI00017EE839|nr:hypothetical protein [Synechococcus sp. PCC 7335]EDX82965.1 hypothetical protein S7335_143 [Synechococcus sp. PCC 7335]
MLYSKTFPVEFSQRIQVQLDEFRTANPLQALDRIQSIYEQAHKCNVVWVLTWTFLLPGPAWIAVRSNQLLSQPSLKTIRPGVVLVYPLIIIATLLYLVMMWHLLPAYTGMWQVFTEPSTIGNVLMSLWHKHTFRTVCLITLNIVVAKWALSSCVLTETFQAQRDSLKESCTQKWKDTAVQVAVEQELVAQQPELMQNFISQATTLILANAELTDIEQQKLVALLPQILQSSKLLQTPMQTISPSMQDKVHNYGMDPFS